MSVEATKLSCGCWFVPEGERNYRPFRVLCPSCAGVILPSWEAMNHEETVTTLRAQLAAQSAQLAAYEKALEAVVDLADLSGECSPGKTIVGMWCNTHHNSQPCEVAEAKRLIAAARGTKPDGSGT